MTMALNRQDLSGGSFSHRQIAATLSSRVQELIILPTEKCNFRCTYCYEDFMIGKMSEEVQRSLERYMDRRIPELSALSIHWFGGEPLVAKKVVLRLASHAHRLCLDQGVSLKGALTTNGYILDTALFEELLSYDQRFFQITLDGWGNDHDVVRKLANGRGTFDRLWGNLLATRASVQDFTILIRIHVRRGNLPSVKILLSHIATAFGGDPRYSLDFEHLRNLGGKGGKSVERPFTVTELREMEKALREHYEHEVRSNSGSEVFANHPAQPLVPDQANASGVPAIEPYICYAARPNSLLIRADGRIGKCTVALRDDRNTIGRVNDDGTFTIDNDRLRPWVRGLADLDEQALECPLRGLPSQAIVEPRKAVSNA